MRGAHRRAEESRRVLEAHRGDTAAVKLELDQQFAALQSRAQVLLGICGVLITASVLITTGRILGRGTYELQHVAGWLLAFAGLCDIASTAIVVSSVLNVRWLTQLPTEDLRRWLGWAIEYRDRKTFAYHVALGLVLLSMTFYQAAVLIVVLQL
jgi:hypothetical protein